MRAEELSDQLLLAAEQHDVSSVLVTLRQMKEENCLEQAINNNHSHKGDSALTSILTHFPFSQADKFILELLLLSGARYGWEEIAMVAAETGENEAFNILLDWETMRRDQAVEARHLLSLEPEDAAAWIEQHHFPSKASSPSPSSLSNNQIALLPQSPPVKVSPDDKPLSSPNWSTIATVDSRSVSPIPAYYRILAECARLPPLPLDKPKKRKPLHLRQSKPDEIIITKVPDPSTGFVRVLLDGLPMKCTRAYMEALLLRYTPSHTGLGVYHLSKSSYALFNVRIKQASRLVSDLNRHKNRKLYCKAVDKRMEIDGPLQPQVPMVNSKTSFETVENCSRYNFRARPSPQPQVQNQLQPLSDREEDLPLLTESNLKKLQVYFSPRPTPLSVEAEDHSFVTCNYGSTMTSPSRSGTPSIPGRLLSSPPMSIDDNFNARTPHSPLYSPRSSQISHSLLQTSTSTTRREVEDEVERERIRFGKG